MESHISAGARELDEEISGFLGCRTNIEKMLKKCPVFHSTDVTEFLLPLDWDTYKMLPLFFNRSRTSLLTCLKPNKENGILEIQGCPKGYFEKSKIAFVRLDKLARIFELSVPSAPSGVDAPSLVESDKFIEEDSGPFRPSFKRTFSWLYKLGAFDKISQLYKLSFR